MDKQGKTITIKINGKDRPVHADKKMQDNGSKKKPKQEEPFEKPKYYKEKSNSYQITEVPKDRSKVYSLDNDAVLNETAAAQEHTEESFDWILPDPVEEEIIKEYKIAPKQEKKPKKKSIGISVWNTKSKKNNRLYTTIIMNVLFAVLLGTAFGVTFLKFLPSEPDTAAPAVAQPTPGQAEEKPAGGKESIELTSIPTFVVQNGVFTTEAAAKERVNLLAGQGVTAELFPVNGQFAVYLGTAGSIEAAKQQAEALKAKGVEVFAKPFEIAGGTAAGLTAAESEFLKQAPEIHSILMSGAAAGPEEVQKAEKYQNMISKIEDKSVKDKTVLKAKASMERAGAAFINYQKSKDANQLAEMEISLLAFLSAYQSIGK
ncbi:SPOR domain-containing protein [Mesobacillus selenatarsenatis]|uniref:Stage II sporulation protein B n=1 Tax=Mesobacillus selenatarsenatis (strain DSM 18680 / JCM 14380 / FERM P-15431 / SF-1) TaxID=1321606 RepID=A0A0A8WZ80_MESS1|nr:SPOR domain-containing protein [Mesobacillus selenatarsenatis]GAM12062.1 stage II sporulation protein B [Mesobacillus selenatarsenatis SF-1]